ncbi:MAG: 50S ribosomal protein L44e [Candidatus Woesearchaeota archaeon]
MKVPKLIKKYCKFCKTHTEQKVVVGKQKTRGSAHPLSQGSKPRMKIRGVGQGMGNMGKLSRGAMTSWKRYNKKQSKKLDLRYTCKQCNKTTSKRHTIRAKKVEQQ